MCVCVREREREREKGRVPLFSCLEHKAVRLWCITGTANEAFTASHSLLLSLAKLRVSTEKWRRSHPNNVEAKPEFYFRGSDMSQKQASKGPMPVRISRCDSDPLHRRPVTLRSPRLGGERRGTTQSDSSNQNQKKLGSRISDLESQLGQAQEELKILKGQMNTVKIKRTTTREQQQAGKNSSKKPSRNPPPKPKEEGIRESSDDNKPKPETDVFEVPVEEITPQSKQIGFEPGRRDEEINLLKVMLEEKMKEVENSHEENEKLKMEMEKRGSGVSSAEAKEEEMRSRVKEMIQELEGSRCKREELMVKLEGMEAEKEEMEVEMKKLRIQTEQWRKAADAAAIVLSEGGQWGGTEMKERRMSERWGGGSMEKQYGNIFENPVGGYADDIEEEEEEEEEEFSSNGKRRSSGIRMLGELWKKKVGHK